MAFRNLLFSSFFGLLLSLSSSVGWGANVCTPDKEEFGDRTPDVAIYLLSLKSFKDLDEARAFLSLLKGDGPDFDQALIVRFFDAEDEMESYIVVHSPYAYSREHLTTVGIALQKKEAIAKYDFFMGLIPCNNLK